MMDTPAAGNAASGIPEEASERELLAEAAYALHSFALCALVVRPWLDKPYLDAPELSPWTNTVGAQARRAHDLSRDIRKRVGLPHRHADRALGTPPLEEADVIAEAVAAERERLAAVISPDQFRKLADWFDTDDEFKTTMFPETWPPGSRAPEVQSDLRRFADLLEGDRD